MAACIALADSTVSWTGFMLWCNNTCEGRSDSVPLRLYVRVAPGRMLACVCYYVGGIFTALSTLLTTTTPNALCANWQIPHSNRLRGFWRILNAQRIPSRVAVCVLVRTTALHIATLLCLTSSLYSPTRALSILYCVTHLFPHVFLYSHRRIERH